MTSEERHILKALCERIVKEKDPGHDYETCSQIVPVAVSVHAEAQGAMKAAKHLSGPAAFRMCRF